MLRTYSPQPAAIPPLYKILMGLALLGGFLVGLFL